MEPTVECSRIYIYADEICLVNIGCSTSDTVDVYWVTSLTEDATQHRHLYWENETSNAKTSPRIQQYTFQVQLHFSLKKLLFKD